ncbi:MAG: 3-deoxy-D-manno-octulosonic acid transferase [Desulfobulbaceae bacterium]|nr:3-deoxy-D-manno-octulosonic acid transferase [Desulfobulbaceae bacterium]
MLVFYNILQLFALLLLGPFLALWVFCSAKYRDRIPGRLGLGLTESIRNLRPGKRVWIHALSVGEMASSLPLLQALRREMPELVIILSSTTRGGAEYGKRLQNLVDCQVPFPLDFFWVTTAFVKTLHPDLFVLIETDFWPNLLHCLARQKVPSLLVNGRITTKSMARYQRFRFLFRPLFASFTKMTMQMADDSKRLTQLGVSAEKIVVCGNLKYDMPSPFLDEKKTLLSECGLNKGMLFVAGSTHDGEESVLFELFSHLCELYPALAMVIAPRSIERAAEIMALGKRGGLLCHRRTANDSSPCHVLILDTIGELASVYQQADIAFVGGSLVPEGGHNPLEPAFFSKPVLFGPDMSDFAEISRDLLQAGGAKMVTIENIYGVTADLLADVEKRQEMGRRAGELLLSHQGTALRHVTLIRESLENVR